MTSNGVKLLYIAPIRLPTEKAHGIQIMETCGALSCAGADVELLVTDRKTPIKDDAFDFYNIKTKFNITRLHTPDTVSYGRLGYLFYVIFFGLRAALYARRARADVVYTRDPVTFCIFSVVGIRPLAWEVHTAHPGVPRAILRTALGVVPITRGLAAWYGARGVPAGSLHVAPDAVDLQAFSKVDREAARTSLRSRLGMPPGGKIALYVGSFGLYAWKGVDIAKQAAEFLPEVTWLFVGGSAKECEELTHEATPNVRTLPRAGRCEIPTLLSGADVLLLPNKSGDPASERDTSPMKLFEYMASGVPIVASDISSLREVLDENVAFLVPPNEPKALAGGVRRALAEVSEASAKAGRAQSAAASYTWDRRAENLLAFLQRRITMRS